MTAPESFDERIPIPGRGATPRQRHSAAGATLAVDSRYCLAGDPHGEGGQAALESFDAKSTAFSGWSPGAWQGGGPDSTSRHRVETRSGFEILPGADALDDSGTHSTLRLQIRRAAVTALTCSTGAAPRPVRRAVCNRCQAAFAVLGNNPDVPAAGFPWVAQRAVKNLSPRDCESLRLETIAGRGQPPTKDGYRLRSALPPVKREEIPPGYLY